MMEKKKVLIVEDDVSLGEIIKNKLTEDYWVKWAVDCRSALEMFAKEDFDLVVLDIGLPDGNGFELAEQISKSGKGLPYIFLTAQSDAESRLRGYELGGEEFIPKPFHFKELLLRVKHVLSQHATSQIIKLKTATVDIAQMSITRQDGRIEYPSVSDFKILKLLIEKSPKPISRDEIIDEVWGEDKEVSHRTIDNAIVRLREYLGSSSEEVLRSVRSVGYQWLND